MLYFTFCMPISVSVSEGAVLECLAYVLNLSDMILFCYANSDTC